MAKNETSKINENPQPYTPSIWICALTSLVSFHDKIDGTIYNSICVCIRSNPRHPFFCKKNYRSNRNCNYKYNIREPHSLSQIKCTVILNFKIVKKSAISVTIMSLQLYHCEFPNVNYMLQYAHSRILLYIAHTFLRSYRINCIYNTHVVCLRIKDRKLVGRF